MRKSLEEKFWERVIPEPMSGCWLWLGEISNGGYSRFHGGTGLPKAIPAHRFSYELHKGQIKNGLTLDHLCRIRSCVNPAHLEPVSSVENVLRGEGITADNHRKTHCKEGHEYTEENTRWMRGGKKRQCRTCERKWSKTSKENQRKKKL